MLELFFLAKQKPEVISLIKEIGRVLGYPTTGDFAGALWQLCSGNGVYCLSPKDAAALYAEMGYAPFAGYPLQRG